MNNRLETPEVVDFFQEPESSMPKLSGTAQRAQRRGHAAFVKTVQ